MSQRVAFVTGAGGEMGRLLVPALRAAGVSVVALDLLALPARLSEQCLETVEASVLDHDVTRDLMQRHTPAMVFHLAALLSRKAEDDPDLAHRVNVEATYHLFQLCRKTRSAQGDAPRFLFPSSIAVYGLPDARTKQRQGAVKETEWTLPTGMYGCNKRYCEMIGSYFSRPATGRAGSPLDFRAIRFPGLISAETLPTGGTTDYAPEMIHAAAQGKPYSCFVSADSRLPFMTMPDAVEALLQLASVEADSLSTRVYNIRGFSASAAELRAEVLEHFPDAQIDFASMPERQAIVDSWPADIDDELARKDWGLAPRHDLVQAHGSYLAPALRRRYARCAGGPEELPREP